MRFLLLSDLHLEFNDFDLLSHGQAPEFDAVLLAGDLHSPGRLALDWAKRPGLFGRDVPILMVLGNHDFYGAVFAEEAQDMCELARSSAVDVLNCNERVLHVPGAKGSPLVRVLGCTLWTDYLVPFPNGNRSKVKNQRLAMANAHRNLADFRRIGMRDPALSLEGLRTVRPEEILERHMQERQWLQSKLVEPFDGATVVMTHHGPHLRCLDPKYAGDFLNPCFFSDLPPPFFRHESSPSLWVHGHTHASVDFRDGRTWVRANPRGYRIGGTWENPRFNPQLVVEI